MRFFIPVTFDYKPCSTPSPISFKLNFTLTVEKPMPTQNVVFRSTYP